VDLSVCPQMDWSNEGGPNFLKAPIRPYWFGTTRKLLELPLTAGFTGLLRQGGDLLYKIATDPLFMSLHAPGVLARLHLLDKIRLSPEGFTLVELKRLVKDLYGDGVRCFTLAFHSPSVEPGHTPYVRTSEDLTAFLACLRGFFDFFMEEFAGKPMTPLEFKRQLRRPT